MLIQKMCHQKESRGIGRYINCRGLENYVTRAPEEGSFIKRQTSGTSSDNE